MEIESVQSSIEGLHSPILIQAGPFGPSVAEAHALPRHSFAKVEQLYPFFLIGPLPAAAN